MSDETSREAFEAALRAEPSYDSSALERQSDGRYDLNVIEAAWQGWQMRAAFAAPSAVVGELPALPAAIAHTPPHNRNFVGLVYAFTADQMRQYGQDCAAAALKARPAEAAEPSFAMSIASKPLGWPAVPTSAALSDERIIELRNATWQPAEGESPSRPWGSALRFARAIQAAVAAAPAPAALSDEQIRARWKDAGGRFFGPNVETGSMPESLLLPFLRSLAAAGHPVPAETQAHNPP